MKNICLTLLTCLALASQASAQSVVDPGFEKPVQAAGKFSYRPTTSAWTFTGGSGLSANYSGFTSNNPVAPQGSQVALIQNIGSISQTVSFPAAGSFILTMKACQRNYPQPFGHQNFAVAIDGQVAANITPGGTTYQTYYVLLPSVAAGDHVLAISGLNSAGGDNTAFHLA
jgi:hypothetical protein